jgi:riboflavin kinase/FMN adenylyltransferase
MRQKHYGMRKTRKTYRVAALGNFDGLHVGHQALIRHVTARAAETNGRALLVTFEPHPIQVLAPHLGIKLLDTLEEKSRWAKRYGIEEVIAIPFTKRFAAQSPERFVRNVLRRRLRLDELFVGKDFAFGKDRAGTVKDLERLGALAGIRVGLVPPVVVDGVPVGSRRIRELLAQGRVAETAKLLGRPFSLEGVVVRGAGRGAGLGFPTANLIPPDEIQIPADGVYITRAGVAKRFFPAATYIGTQPTFGSGSTRRIETTLLLGRPQSLYRKRLRVEFLERVRGDRAFGSSEALVDQIRKDVEQARIFFGLIPKRKASSGQ